MWLIRFVLRWCSIIATLLVVIGFVLFVIDQAQGGVQAQIEAIEIAQGPALKGEAEQRRALLRGGGREMIDDANDILLRPFNNVVHSEQIWVQRGVPTLLALLVYGLLLGLVANSMKPRRHREIQSFGGFPRG